MMRAETCLSHDNYCKKWKVKVLVTQSCPILCDPMDCGLPDSSVHGILQTRILEGVAIPFSRGSSQPRGWTHVSCTAGRFFTVLATRESESEITQSCPTLMKFYCTFPVFCVWITIYIGTNTYTDSHIHT